MCGNQVDCICHADWIRYPNNPNIGDSESRLGFSGERSARRCVDNARIKKIEREK